MAEKFSAFLRRTAFSAEWTCALCGREIFGGGHFCKTCAAELPYNGGGICLHCGRQVKESAPVCPACENRLPDLDAGRSPFVYQGGVADLIRKFKYGGARWLAEVFAPYLAETWEKSGFRADVALWVPMTAKEQKKRGFNQSELLAGEFSLLTGIPALGLLEKKRETARQAGLGGEARRKNTEGAFRTAEKGGAAGKTLLVLDDVTTTGATLQAAANALKRQGAERVYALTIASVPWENFPREGSGETEKERESADS